MPATSPRARARPSTAPRAVDLSDATPNPLEQIDAALTALALKTDEKNKAAAEEKKLQTALEKAMTTYNVNERTLVVAGQKRQATIADREKDVVNIDKLVKVTNREAFLKIVSATHTAVKDALGSNILAQVLDTVPAGRSLKVERIKD